jgi:hypothetical protein
LVARFGGEKCDYLILKWSAGVLEYCNVGRFINPLLQHSNTPSL